MSFIVSAMDDFYQCCDVPVKAISSHVHEIYKIGYNKHFDDIFPFDKIKSIINSSKEISSFQFDMENDIYYKIINIPQSKESSCFFILGPMIKKQLDNNFHDIPLRSFECCNYMCNLILNICDDKFNKKIGLKHYNIYIKKAIKYVHEHYNEDITISSLCEYLDINKCYFCNIFKKSTGSTFSYFLNHFRVEKSKKLLKETDFSLLDIALSVGFNNQNYYSITFKKYTNKTPSEYRSMQNKSYSDIY